MLNIIRNPNVMSLKSPLDHKPCIKCKVMKAEMTLRLWVTYQCIFEVIEEKQYLANLQ